METLKGQLEQKQTDCSRFQKETVNLKAQLNTEQREHKESYLDLENEQSGYMTQVGFSSVLLKTRFWSK